VKSGVRFPLLASGVVSECPFTAAAASTAAASTAAGTAAAAAAAVVLTHTQRQTAIATISAALLLSRALLEYVHAHN
jgi:hypothetical protein